MASALSVNTLPVPLDASRLPRRAVVRIADRYMHVAAVLMLENGGIEVVDADDGTFPLITDDHRLHSKRTILIIDDSVGAAQVALAALRSGRLGGVVSRHFPEQLMVALSAMGHSLMTVPTNVLDAVESAPPLDVRALRILTLVAAGMSNNRIAERLAISDATVKREISDLFRIFDCSTRIELAIKAAEVGYALS